VDGVISFGFFVSCLLAVCLVVSIVYALTTCDSPGDIAREAIWSFVLITGGLFVLGFIVKIVPDIFRG
jgi:flagellar biosynthesis protein FliQ